MTTTSLSWACGASGSAPARSDRAARERGSSVSLDKRPPYQVEPRGRIGDRSCRGVAQMMLIDHGPGMVPSWTEIRVKGDAWTTTHAGVGGVRKLGRYVVSPSPGR